jgi:putative transposase
MARSTYYYTLSAIRRPDKYSDARMKLNKLHIEHQGRYGYRRLTSELRKEGLPLNHKTVSRLMKEESIECKIRRKRKKYFAPSPELEASPNVLNRDFTATEPYKKAVTDVTEFWIKNTKIYVSALIDLYDGAVISTSYSTSNNTNLIMSMFDRIPKNNKAFLVNMLVHSDQGVLYRTNRYKNYLNAYNIIQSMSRRGNCYDNAVAECFFGTFKSEVLYIKDIPSIEVFKQEFEEYIHYYNYDRIKSKLGYLSPMQYRKMNGY